MRYRSQLFFGHLIAYALLQACAAAVDHNLDLTNGIKLILGGNGWGLLLFSEWKRSSALLHTEADQVLGMLKEGLSESASEEDKSILEKVHLSGVALLNEKNLSDAKTSVALGAAEAIPSEGATERTEPYAGVTIPALRVNESEPETVRWSDRWSYAAFNGKFGTMRQIDRANFEHPEQLNRPMDRNLAVFTGLGNISRLGVDNLPANEWQQVNSELISSVRQTRVEGGRLVVTDASGERHSSSPINFFISQVLYPSNNHRDFLDVLAEVNKCASETGGGGSKR
jgi:hypothetical protein